MLRTLAIRNLAIIDRLDLEFGAGLNVLTGETGAGKSIVIGGLAAILGGRVDTGMVRSGAERAVVDAVFDISASPALCAAVSDAGFDCEDGELLLSREIAATGKSSARIAGRPATIAQLREIGAALVDLHGQHEHQSLLSVPRHLDILDDWGGEEVWGLREQAGTQHALAARLTSELTGLERDARDRVREIDLCSFQVEEIAQAELTPGEDEDLEAEHRRLAGAQRLAEAIGAATTALEGDDGPGASAAISMAVRCLETVADLDPALAGPLDALRAIGYEIDEAARDVVRYGNDIEHNPARLLEIEERLDLIRTLKRKYGDTVEEVIAFGAAAAERLDALAGGEARTGEVRAELAAARERLAEACGRLSMVRRAVAERFGEAVTAELGDLAMARTRFEAAVAPAEPSPRGADRVEFLIATNPGEPLRPLARIASGGEISRVMLALKSALARREALPTMVFDEIDVGVGGRTAAVIGGKIAALAGSAQVLCITHLPQIASRGERHFRIEKLPADDRTVVRVVEVLGGERVVEIARMLGGAEGSEAALQHAREMLEPERSDLR